MTDAEFESDFNPLGELGNADLSDDDNPDTVRYRLKSKDATI